MFFTERNTSLAMMASSSGIVNMIILKPVDWPKNDYRLAETVIIGREK